MGHLERASHWEPICVLPSGCAEPVSRHRRIFARPQPSAPAGAGFLKPHLAATKTPTGRPTEPKSPPPRQSAAWRRSSGGLCGSPCPPPSERCGTAWHVMPIGHDVHGAGRSAVRAEEIGADARPRLTQRQGVEPDIDHAVAVEEPDRAGDMPLGRASCACGWCQAWPIKARRGTDCKLSIPWDSEPRWTTACRSYGWLASVCAASRR
jgi:hypothetical protein